MLRNLLFICLIFIFVTACTSEMSDMPETQTTDSVEASESTQDVAGDHSDEEGEHSDEDADQHGHEDENENERRELGAHEHGAAELMIAWSGSDVAIDLETPAYNILGFEYAPTSDEEKALLEEAVAALEAGGLLQLSPDAGCTLMSASVQTGFSEEGHDSDEEGHHDDEEGHDEEGHDSDEKDHDEEGHHGDEEGHDEESHGEETHSDIDVSYNLECQAPENIESLDASNLFAQFPNFEDIQVQWISDTQQSATDLTPDNPVLALK